MRTLGARRRKAAASTEFSAESRQDRIVAQAHL
jgi:hypothetical protein